MGCLGPADTRQVDPSSKLLPTARPAGTPSRGRSTQIRRVRLGAVIAIALAVVFGIWLVVRAGGDGGPARDEPVSSAASVAQLGTLPEQTGHPVYWAGPLADHVYELTRPTDGNVYVRYLPAGTAIGDRRPDYTTIGTYPRRGALKGLRKLAQRPEAVTFPVAQGGIAVYSRDRPRSIYLAFPGQDVQVEVYDPSPQKARRLARSGRVRPVG
jgi:hypothetical protein